MIDIAFVLITTYISPVVRMTYIHMYIHMMYSVTYSLALIKNEVLICKGMFDKV